MANVLPLLLPLVVVVGVVALAGIHQVPEGHVGLYFVGGALKNVTCPPGWHVTVRTPATKEN